MDKRRRIFMTGGTGYIGSRLIPVLTAQGHEVVALAREASRNKLPGSCSAVCGDALDGDSYADLVEGADTFIHLVGVAHPSPAKAREFVAVDGKSATEAFRVAKDRRIEHFIYVSVAHPAPAMHAYVRVRTGCEEKLTASGMNSTIVRPWYVLGPQHRWPYVLIPIYAMARALPQTRDGAIRLGLLTLKDMVGVLAIAANHPATGIRILNVPDIRRIARDVNTIQ